ncbi:MAG: hypothetical protein ACLPX5_03805 [Dissulfurispiraceae bacterium]
MGIELTPEEKEVLKHALEVYLSDLREEIYKTESHDSKPPLKREEEVLKSILAKL